MSAIESASDGELALAIGAGPAPREEAELCRRLAPRVLAYGRRHLRDEAGAKDLVQSVLVVALQSLRAQRVEEPDRIGSFVLGTCRQVVGEWRRNERRRRELLDQAAPVMAELATISDEPATLDRGRLAECLNALAPRQLTIVLLTYYADQDASEIALELGLEGGNVRVLRHRALKALLTCMGGEAG